MKNVPDGGYVSWERCQMGQFCNKKFNPVDLDRRLKMRNVRRSVESEKIFRELFSRNFVEHELRFTK